MKLPLVVFSLIYLLVLLAHAVSRTPRPPRGAFSAGTAESTAPAWELALKEMLTDTLRLYVPLAGAALVSMIFGKPGLGPQYAAWGVIFVTLLLWVSVWSRQQWAKLPLVLIGVALLAYMWILQLPVFDVVPR